MDPDPDTRTETEALLAGAEDAVQERFGDRLVFGTAGLRGALGAGPMRMNRVMVRMTAAAVARHLLAGNGLNGAPADSETTPVVVVCFDARHMSDVFAEDTVRVLAARGVASILLPGPLPTPVLAFTLRDLGADAGIMVTASHNPRADNGYKVYWSDGAQIISPIDSEISALIDEAPLPTDNDLADADSPLIRRAGQEEVLRYVEATASVVQTDSPRCLSVVYTPLHGVGRATLLGVFENAGFNEPMVVPEQGDPDPDFPTVEYPNPEVPGALDLAIALAADAGADIVLANDPDADRLAVAVPDGSSWRTLTGDDVGVLLADHVLTGGSGHNRLVATTVVSSRMLESIAAHHGVRHAETLTGFKWIVRPGLLDPSADFVFGYEEAAGFAVGGLVRDKDGITAALAFAELAATEKAAGRTVIDRLHDLWQRHGLHRTGLRTIRFNGPDAVSRMAGLMDNLRTNPPETMSGMRVMSVTDLAEPGSVLPPTDTIVFNLDGGRLVVRPSGTEPMLKAYAEVIDTSPDDDLAEAEAAATRLLDHLLDGAGLMLTGAVT
ncbi:MAG TPA: phospho-sugar mutase [Acidimicrobiales bacterium]|nr:phospho-sugar mutase [Acidimicrobiales bacterium]HJL89765.1 phospho-sugar mutase [Acidimicrobiales bacterium]HJO99188.1 phospho-sugar mutase [Acidimicrobiales bacterium]